MKGSITISRTQRGDGAEVITIQLKDTNSLVRFLEVTISPRDLAMALTGLSELEVEYQAAGLEHLGKRKIRESRSVECDLCNASRDKLEKWLAENCQEDGWTLDGYLRSQNSVDRSGGKTLLRYAVYRYEEVKP